jgi:predicted nucleic acid-binding protein
MVSERAFVDTWGWLVLANADDPAFPRLTRLRQAAAGKKGAWVTTDYVLDETITRLFSAAPFAKSKQFCEAIFETARLGSVTIETVTAERFQAAWQMRIRYRDKPRISFTDLTSFSLMRELRLSAVITGDAHFEQAGLGFRILS